MVSLCRVTLQERKEEGAKESNAEVPVEAQDLTVFVQSVMEQMVREERELLLPVASSLPSHYILHSLLGSKVLL